MNKNKVLFLFSNKDELIKLVFEGKAPSNALYAADLIEKNSDYTVEFRGFGIGVKNIFHNLKLFFDIFLFKKYKIVFSTQYLSLLLLKKIFLRTKWVLYNINFCNLLSLNFNKRIKKHLLIQALNSANNIICLSEFQKKDLVSYGVREKNISVIEFGVDDNFYQADYSNKGEYILSVGKDNGRDFDYLIDLSEQLNERVVIVTSKRLSSRFRELPDNVKVFNEIGFEDLRKVYSKAKLVVVPTKSKNRLEKERSFYSDCSGQTVVLDAMAMGKPVIASDMKWIRDYNIENLIFTYNADNQEELLDKIKYVLQNQVISEQKVKLAREVIEEKYNTSRMAKGFIDIFDLILK